MLSIPEIDTDAAIDSAAIAYAEAGWYVLPVRSGKHAGSRLGKGWPAKSSRDPKQIIAWFAASSDALALHCGRSGAVVFDIDHPERMPAVLAEAVLLPPFQTTRAGSLTRGHAVFLAPEGRSLGNSKGKINGSWGEVRGRNGIIVVAPSMHAKADEGGRYAWIRHGVVPVLPGALAVLLPDTTDAHDAATDAEVSGFILAHRGADRPVMLDNILSKLTTRLTTGESRHEAVRDCVVWAMREVAAGCFPGTVAATRLLGVFVAAMASSRDGRERVIGAAEATSEYHGMLSWAVAQAKIADPAALRERIDSPFSAPDLGVVVQWPPPPALVAVEPLNGRRLILTPASAFKPARVRWGWANRMPVGELTLIPGREGVGKSLFLAWLAAQVTRGSLPGEFLGSVRPVLYVASEDAWEYTITPRLLAAGADLDLVYRVDATAEGPVTLPADCDLLVDAVRETNAAAAMLDPVISLIDDRLSVNQARELRRALEPLRRAAERAGIFVPALAHFNKTSDTDVLSKIPGARAWSEVARAALGIAQDTDAGHYVASQIKNNLGRLDLPNLTYTIGEVMIDTDDGPASVGKLIWGEDCDTGVEEVLSRRPERAARDTSQTTDAVVAYIEECGYPMPLKDLYDRFPLVNQKTLAKACQRAADRHDLSNPTHGHYGPARR